MGTDSEKLFSICEREKAAVKSRVKRQRQRDKDGKPQIRSYQISNDFLKELGTFLHLILRASQLDNVTLLRRVGEVDNDLDAQQITLSKQSKLIILQ